MPASIQLNTNTSAMKKIQTTYPLTARQNCGLRRLRQVGQSWVSASPENKKTWERLAERGLVEISHETPTRFLVSLCECETESESPETKAGAVAS